MKEQLCAHLVEADLMLFGFNPLEIAVLGSLPFLLIYGIYYITKMKGGLKR